MTLRNHMRDHLTQWRDHIPAQWTEMLDGMNPDFEANARGLDINHDFPTGPAFPPLLRNHDVPSLFRTFREIEPAQVRVIVVGQDPYPEPNRATGRAFEDWAVQNGEVADSCKRGVSARTRTRGVPEPLRRGEDPTAHWASAQDGQAFAELGD